MLNPGLGAKSGYPSGPKTDASWAQGLAPKPLSVAAASVNTMAATPVRAAPLTCDNGVLDVDEVCDDGSLDRDDGRTRFCTLENDWRGGGGCAVEWDSSRNGPG